MRKGELVSRVVDAVAYMFLPPPKMVEDNIELLMEKDYLDIEVKTGCGDVVVYI